MLFVQVRKLEWRCRGCFSISDTKESRVAVLENELPLSLIFPDRYNRNTKGNHPNTMKYHPNTTTHLQKNNPKILRFSIVRDEAGFSLSISPSRSDDSGIYFCLVNGAEEPTRGLRLAIQVPSPILEPFFCHLPIKCMEITCADCQAIHLQHGEFDRI